MFKLSTFPVHAIDNKNNTASGTITCADRRLEDQRNVPCSRYWFAFVLHVLAEDTDIQGS